MTTTGRGDPLDDSEDGHDENDVATTKTPKKRCENLAKRCENDPKRAEDDSKTTRRQPKTIRKTYGKFAVLNVSRLRKSTIDLDNLAFSFKFIMSKNYLVLMLSLLIGQSSINVST